MDPAAKPRPAPQSGAGRPTAEVLEVAQLRQINRDHGVPVGDRILRQVAEALVAGLTACDTTCRISGDAFGIILPETSLARAAEVAENLRSRIDDLALVVGGMPVSFTASLGIAAADPSGTDGPTSAADMLRQAETALTKAKEWGGNQVCSV